MKPRLLFFFVAILSAQLGAAPPASPTPDYPETASTWPGIKMQVLEVDRVPNGRVVLLIRLLATKDAPASTLIGSPAVIPPNTRKEDMGNFEPEVYTLDGSTMTDDLTQVKYTSLAPDPHGPTFRSSTTLETLSPGGACLLCIQFPMPPPPQPDNNGIVPKQTVSVMLPRAKGPITKVVIPPPASANGAAPSAH